MHRKGRDARASNDVEATVSAAGTPGVPRSGRHGDVISGLTVLRPGTIVGERYRIVGKLGQGGMGEVFRADDLELGTAVALKFLPVELAGDPVRLERLRREVRLARQVTHPNVCRVHDIGTAEGRSFLTMEFIDGEDLASLLRRIGRLPEDKAVELAGQICTGLAAAHEHDLAHCDLKPANVMIDGRGRARLTDFGLAAAIRDPHDGPDPRAGTPAYMAPEQLAGAKATKRSDIYALGLVLYELFTGRPAHAAEDLTQLRELHRSSTPPSSPAELVRDLDSSVDRVIMQCLEPDPEDRPPSALAVLAALPGRDPLRALLEAGETPSPELVAASGRQGILAPARALQLAAVIAVGFLLIVWPSGFGTIEDSVGEILPPAVLEHRARETLADAGYTDPPVDTALGFDLVPGTLGRLKSLSKDERRAVLRSEEDPVFRFWYRGSPVPLTPWRSTLPGGSIASGSVTPFDPPPLVPGMAFVRLGPRGRLLELHVVGGEDESGGGSRSEAARGLSVLLAAAGFSASGVEHAIETFPPAANGRWSWPAGISSADAGGAVDARFSGGRPLHFRVGSANGASRASWSVEVLPGRFEQVQNLTLLAFLIGGAFVAGANVRSGRWDRRGAVRLAFAAFVLCGVSVVIGGHHTREAAIEARQIFMAVAYGSSRALLTWLLYVAIEPFIRRSHPTLLVSWTRLLAGRWRDPAVGRDVLIGLAVGVGVMAASAAWTWARGWAGATLPFMAVMEGGNPLGTANSLMVILRTSVVGVGSSLGFLLVYVALRGLLGSLRGAVPVVFAVVVFASTFAGMEWGLEPIDDGAIAFVAAVGWTFLAVRSGLLAFAACAAMTSIGSTLVFTPDLGDWYAGASLLYTGLLVVLTIYGVRTSTGGARFVPKRL